MEEDTEVPEACSKRPKRSRRIPREDDSGRRKIVGVIRCAAQGAIKKPIKILELKGVVRVVDLKK